MQYGYERIIKKDKQKTTRSGCISFRTFPLASQKRTMSSTSSSSLSTQFMPSFFLLSISTNCHLPNTDRVEVRNVKQAMRERTLNDLTSLQQIVEQEMRKALLTAEVLALLPSMPDIGMYHCRLFNIDRLMFYVCLHGCVSF
jgi:hypothetical protein